MSGARKILEVDQRKLSLSGLNRILAGFDVRITGTSQILSLEPHVLAFLLPAPPPLPVPLSSPHVSPVRNAQELALPRFRTPCCQSGLDGILKITAQQETNDILPCSGQN